MPLRLRKQGPAVSTDETSAKQSEFDIHDATKIIHTRMGVWDMYSEKEKVSLWHFPGTDVVTTLASMSQNAPYLWRMIKDVSAIERCWLTLALYLLVELLSALLPALSIWYSGRLLKIVQIAVDTRTVDKSALINIASGRVACVLATHILGQSSARLQISVDGVIRQHYSVKIFKALARIDVPTYEDPAVQRQFDKVWSGRSNVAWTTMQKCVSILRQGVQLLSQLFVLAQVLVDQRDGALLAFLSALPTILSYINTRANPWGSNMVWAATINNDDYSYAQGLRQVLTDDSHRKEFVAGNLASVITVEYERAVLSAGIEARDFMQSWMHHANQADSFKLTSLLRQPLRELPQIAFTLRAVQRPADIPVSLASLHLLQQSVSQFASSFTRFSRHAESIGEQLATLRKLYDIADIANKVQDGTDEFIPTAAPSVSGVSVEFKNVSFRYPSSEKYALQDVSFRIDRGQLCVIVGSNGSGKSTILKLLLRLYDIDAGQILINDQDITTLKLSDLRRTITVLFQDFTHFPLRVKHNIGLGNPEHFNDNDRIREAAKLGGAEELIEQMPDGFDTYLKQPVPDQYSGLPEGTTTLFGRKVDYSGIRRRGGLGTSTAIPLSGGQLQRLALARTFMRSLPSDPNPKVNLLLFDEPSASLDPSAEHDLFERLRELRGQKTMIFSSHRFGSLTRHANLILYINDSKLVEMGTHDELLRTQGEYARLWMLQAKAFID